MTDARADWEQRFAAYAAALLNWHRRHRYCAACGKPSDVVEGGLTRQCPACGAEHHPRTDPVVIMLVTDGDRLLLGGSFPGLEGVVSQAVIGYDGSSFVAQGPGGLGIAGSIERIAASSSCDVWATGRMTHVGGTPTNAHVVHFTGSAWEPIVDTIPSDAFCPAFAVSGAGEVTQQERENGSLHLTVHCSSARDLVPFVIDAARGESAELRNVQVMPISLEDVFISLTGRALRE